MMTYGARTRNNLQVGASVGVDHQRENPHYARNNLTVDTSPSTDYTTLKWRQRRTSGSSVDGTMVTNDNTSVVTSTTEPYDNSSSALSTNINGHSILTANAVMISPTMELATMRNQTSFGDCSYHEASDMNASPFSVPSGAPDINERGPSTIPCQMSPEQNHLPRSLKLPLLSASPLPANSHFEDKRLHFFDDVASDQVPFDQVWNQQEFSLPDDQKNSDASTSDMKLDELDEELDQSCRTDTSKPFDEGGSNRNMGPSDYSAFSAFSINSSSTTALNLAPPPPARPEFGHRRKSSISSSLLDSPMVLPRSPMSVSSPISLLSANSPESPGILVINRTKPFTSPLPASPKVCIPIRRPISPLRIAKVVKLPAQQSTAHEADLEAKGDQPDIPSDEDESKNEHKLSRLDGRDKQNRSLATASRRRVAEDVGRKNSAEDLSPSGNKQFHISEDSTDREGGDDEKSVDSLFDFKDQASLSPTSNRVLSPSRSVSPKSSPRSPGKWRKRASSERTSMEGDDETSLEDHHIESDVMRLKTRAQEAFATRRRFAPKKGPSTRPLSPRREPSPTSQGGFSISALTGPTFNSVPPQDPLSDEVESQHQLFSCPPKTKNQVSFGATDTIHHFQREDDTYSERDGSSIARNTHEHDRSIKTDVEEAIKDIFMIRACNPSPRRIRQQSTHKSERQESRDSSDEEENATVDEIDSVSKEPAPDADRTTREKIQQVSSETDDIFFEAMMSMVEGSIGVMSAALAFATGENLSADAPATQSSNSRVLPPSEKRVRILTRNGSQIESDIEPLPSDDESEDETETSDDDESEAPEEVEDNRHSHQRRGSQTLEDDPRLLELAKQAALCMHEVLGVYYDESQGVDIGDIKFVVVVLTLPLGIIFQEDYSGCWVTKVMPDGNAGRSRRVEPGDQLAAIGGRSAIGMKVDDICDAISNASSRSKKIELTFLRYVGPFQPLPSDGEPGQSIRLRHMDDEDESDDPYPSQEDSFGWDDKPQSTVSVTKSFNSKSGKSKPQQEPKSSKPSKPGSFRKKFKWLRGRGKKNASKAE